jgi:2-polyprenyl-3-methyl-5-hydroxy-6-metoxy-1,4-benzoquinol methylase
MFDSRIRRHPLGFYEAVVKPSPEELRTYYGERYYQDEKGNYRAEYSETEKRYIENKIHQKAEMVRKIRPDLAGKMLDVGCGEGFTLAYFRRRGGWEVEGLDYSSAGMASMNPDCLDALETGDLMSLLRKRIEGEKRYDLLWLTNVLEHVSDPQNLLVDLRRLIVYNGVLVLTVPNDFSVLQHYLMAESFVDNPFWITLPDHLAYFDRESLESIAVATGWRSAAMLADFPIDWFLLHSGSNYVRDSALGADAHRARVEFENLLAKQPVERVNAFFASMADVGMGRNITAFFI